MLSGSGRLSNLFGLGLLISIEIVIVGIGSNASVLGCVVELHLQ